MAMKDDTAIDDNSSVYSDTEDDYTNDVSKNFKIHNKSRKSTPFSSFNSHYSFRSLSLTNAQLEKFYQRIEIEYDRLLKNDESYCYFIENPIVAKRAIRELERSSNGTFFVRPAEEDERVSNIEYFVYFVIKRKVIQMPICSDRNRREFWFFQKNGYESQILQTYAGLDLLINHKQKYYQYSEQNNFFHTCFNQPFKGNNNNCILLPDHLHSMTNENNILHDLIIEGLIKYFHELIRISNDEFHHLRDKAQFIVKKINGRNKQGQTPLILAIESNRYDFVELLIDKGADPNITDIQGCSPLHYACQQANPDILKKLIDRGANSHYFQKETTDGMNSSNLSAFHYLAMAKEVSSKNIKQCAIHLIAQGCPLMSLTTDGESPFDIAEIHNNNSYKCIKAFLHRRQFNTINPIEVSSRNEAKTFLSDLTCPAILRKIKLRIKQYENRDYFGDDGLFIFYKIKQSRNQSDEEFGLCVYNSGQVSIYPISQQYSRSITDLSEPPQKLVYKYSLTNDTSKDNQTQIILFKSFEELIYSYTKCQGILPILLKDFIKKDNNETIRISASTLVIPYKESHENDSIIKHINIEEIKHFDITQIYSPKILDQNERRFIWLAKVQLNSTISFPIVIKDYIPEKSTEEFRKYRINEFKFLAEHRIDNKLPYEFNSRIYREYRSESRLLLKSLKNHPFIIHTFICNNRPKNDLRIFMEYLSLGNLHSYLIKLKENSSHPFKNVFYWIYQLAQVMAYLSSQNIVHRDLAARNILLKTEKYIKLSDFGLSRMKGVIHNEKDSVLSLRWTAPECLIHPENVSCSADVWSFGIVIWEIFSFGSKPYVVDIKYHSSDLIRTLKRFLIEQDRRLSRPENCSESIYDLMCRCWNLNEDQRPRFIDIVNDLNGTSMRRDCIIPFTREERKAWKKAKEEYLNIVQQRLTVSTSGTEDGFMRETENIHHYSILPFSNEARQMKKEYHEYSSQHRTPPRLRSNKYASENTTETFYDYNIVPITDKANSEWKETKVEYIACRCQRLIQSNTNIEYKYPNVIESDDDYLVVPLADKATQVSERTEDEYIACLRRRFPQSTISSKHSSSSITESDDDYSIISLKNEANKVLIKKQQEKSTINNSSTSSTKSLDDYNVVLFNNESNNTLENLKEDFCITNKHDSLIYSRH